ncbi:MoaD/ThiS family protein [Arcanobacterium phocisimile]|uniref:MoaD/ThiS family protein n=1 Tax=Arcanobacterium phocisimile TaxID=1302235 RepID=A0ABX7IEZ9_9ACTO|nr:MoaD/ThiS family protein [Arcanobacterium phocisimile]QRV01708.1 MoaD/ThiS family protein [Arcanobacterium phocisimile]
MDIIVTVKYFAGIADSAGKTAETISLPAQATLADLIDVLAAEHGEKFRLDLSVCAFLSGGRRLEVADRISDVAELDVLPPFAGG